MDIELLHLQSIESKQFTISGSKSESNRLLLLQFLYPNITIENLSDADDTILMKKALESQKSIIDIHHAGTAMRFLTAYFSMQHGREVILTGSDRMKERPIKILVDALRTLGADIEYLTKQGYPPLRIKGKTLTKNKVNISAQISSQYISALMLIAPKLKNGLEITLDGTITSKPYLEMTLELLNQIGVTTWFENNTIKINPTPIIEHSVITVESDWSSASYFYSIIALSEIGTTLTLSSFKNNSLQGDKALVEIYKGFGVNTVFNSNHSITLSKTKKPIITSYNLQLNNTPDLAQTIAVTCFGLGVKCHLTGLHTLRIKETDRLQALKNELEKLGAITHVTENSFSLESHSIFYDIASVIQKNTPEVYTYQDHRMAMAFAPLALKTDLIIKEAEVVSKSFPKFWEDLKNIGFQVNEI